ncbi:MAG: right-handed parallel beta-helix repeat-containing protein, partial [Bacteroidota bacterium]
MSKSIFYRRCLFYSVIAFVLFSCVNKMNETDTHRSYYFDNNGDDNNEGNKANPFKTINKLNTLQLKPGDTVYFSAGQVFNGSILIDSTDGGDNNNPLVITSSGNGKAVIDGGGATAMTLYQAKFVTISQLSFQGAGRKTGNTKDGLIINKCSNITVDSVNVKGFQKAGLLVNSSADVEVKRVYASENGSAGILASGEWGKRDCRNLHISYCTAENNPGDPTNLTNHSGNGILVGLCKNVVIEYCTATNNGWDMPRIGNGPVGIWCYEADSVVIQHCISYKNKTAAGAADGGGFDLDGGVTNSIIQYCLSYENQGSAFGIFQYDGASNWYNNTIRYCISENDGSVSPAHAGAFIWNSSRDTNQFKNCFFYNNTIYNNKVAAISYEAMSENAGFRFYNNIFVGKDSLIIGKETNSVYLGNNWYSLDDGF